jgi:hypothetical protein
MGEKQPAVNRFRRGHRGQISILLYIIERYAHLGALFKLRDDSYLLVLDVSVGWKMVIQRDSQTPEMTRDRVDGANIHA